MLIPGLSQESQDTQTKALLVCYANPRTIPGYSDGGLASVLASVLCSSQHYLRSVLCIPGSQDTQTEGLLVCYAHSRSIYVFQDTWTEGLQDVLVCVLYIHLGCQSFLGCPSKTIHILWSYWTSLHNQLKIHV